jgi:hypothetical protein
MWTCPKMANIFPANIISHQGNISPRHFQCRMSQYALQDEKIAARAKLLDGRGAGRRKTDISVIPSIRGHIAPTSQPEACRGIAVSVRWINGASPILPKVTLVPSPLSPFHQTPGNTVEQ